MADVKLPNISQANLNVNGQAAMGGAGAQNDPTSIYAGDGGNPNGGRGDGRSQSFHSGRGNGFG